jgi:uncharacterized lipoprotein YbaY
MNNHRQILGVAAALAVVVAACATARAEPPGPAPAPSAAHSAHKHRAPERGNVVTKGAVRPACTLLNNCLVLVGVGQ